MAKIFPAKVFNRNGAPEIVNLEALPHGLNCRYLECLISHHDNPKLIASSWKRKLPAFTRVGYVIVDYENNGGN